MTSKGITMNPDFGYKHITGLIWLFALIIIALVVLLVIRKKYKLGEKFDKAVIKCTCALMWLGEIIKTFRMVNYDDYGPIGYYPLWMGPFHICSMALYAYIILGSKKNGKLSEWVKPFGYAVILIVTSILLVMPSAASILNGPEDWKFCFDNILPYQAWVYHGLIFFVPLYMVLSGFYRPKWSDIYKAAVVLLVCAAGAQALNYGFEGSNADFMTLRYGYGNPFAFLIEISPLLYIGVLAAIIISGTAVVIAATIGIRALVDKKKNKTVRIEE